jgi:multimeric flavodoxin WrbA
LKAECLALPRFILNSFYPNLPPKATGRQKAATIVHILGGVTMRILVVYYSMYGHIHRMAEAVAEGVRSVPRADVALRRVPETLSPEVLAKMGAIEAQNAMGHVQICTVDELATADAIIFGTPTRFGNMCGQMRNDEITGGSPYGASTIAGTQGERRPTENELEAARFQGRHVAAIASKLSA